MIELILIAIKACAHTLSALISVDFDSWGINTRIDSSDIDKESVESILINKESILPK